METPKNIEEALASVEGVLRFEIAQLRQLSIGTREKLIASGGDLYPLPKPKRGEPPKGTPDGWAFASLAPHQVATLNHLEFLDEVTKKLDRAEAALMDGNEPLAVHCTLSAQLSYFSSAGLWQAGSAIALWRHVDQKSKKAKGSIFERWGYTEEEKESAIRWFHANNGKYGGGVDRTIAEMEKLGLIPESVTNWTLKNRWFKKSQ